MENSLFSASALLGSGIVSTSGVTLGAVEDIICNKDTGKVTYLLLACDRSVSRKHRLFAIHHSFFYLDPRGDGLIFDPKVGKDNHQVFVHLPENYDRTTVSDYTAFSLHVLPRLSVAGHRTDSE